MPVTEVDPVAVGMFFLLKYLEGKRKKRIFATDYESSMNIN